MRTYAYRARNTAGRMVAGTVRAADTNDAYALLENDGLVPVAIDPAAGKKRVRASRLFGARVRDEDVIVFTRQLSTMLKAGMPILQALQVLGGQADSPALRQALDSIGKVIDGGSRLSEAMAQFPRIFSPQYVSIVVSGESGADMVEVLLRIAEWMERELDIRTEIKSALRYPIMVAIALVAAAALMVAFVIPRFAVFFARSNVPLPLPTRMLVAGNEMLQHYWPVIVGIIVALPIIAFFLLKVPAIRLRFDRLKFRLPVTGRLYSEIVISRFARIFSMLVRNGVSVLKALEISSNVVSNTYLQESTDAARQSIEGGSSIYEGFNNVSLFPALMTSLIAIGEKTGTLDDMLDFIIVQYDMDIRYSLKNLTAMVEPIITVVIGVGVLFLALAVYLPIWNLSQVLRK